MANLAVSKVPGMQILVLQVVTLLYLITHGLKGPNSMFNQNTDIHLHDYLASQPILSQDSSVGAVWAAGWTVKFQFMAEAWVFSSPQCLRLAFGPTHTDILCSLWPLFL